jgi:hypothetical protein
MALAFDNHRQGFIIGGGIGLSGNRYNQKDIYKMPEYELSSSEATFDFATRTDIRIGGGLKGDKLMLYFWNSINWIRQNPSLGESVGIFDSLSGLGISYYFKPTSPSLYLNAGIGVNHWLIPTKSAELFYGHGFVAGLGYEFTRHISIEFNVKWGKSSTDDKTDHIYNTAWSLSIIGIAY